MQNCYAVLHSSYCSAAVPCRQQRAANSPKFGVIFPCHQFFGCYNKFQHCCSALHTTQGSQHSRSYCNFFPALSFFAAVTLHFCIVIFSLHCSANSRVQPAVTNLLFFFLASKLLLLVRFPAMLLLLSAAIPCRQQRTANNPEFTEFFTCCLLFAAVLCRQHRPPSSRKLNFFSSVQFFSAGKNNKVGVHL